MTRQEYLSIRGEYNFLYRYFVKTGGVNVGEQKFYILLNVWLQRQGAQARQGQSQITKFLDEKFAF